MSLSNVVRCMRALVACGLILLAVPTLAQSPDKPSLFEEAMVFSPPEITSNALRSRSVVITDSAFTGMSALQGRSASGTSVNEAPQVTPVESLRLNLFDDLVVDVDLTNAYQNRSGSQTWVGNIQTDTAEGTAAFVIRDGQVYGAINVPGSGSFSVRPGEYNSHIIEETDGSQLLTGETDEVIPEANDTSNIQSRDATSTEGPAVGGASVAISNDDGSIIDVYVGYDQDAAGGRVLAATAESLAELFIAFTNQAYENSNINQRVWLVGDVDGYDHTSGGESADLTAAQDGSITGLHAKRDEHHADLVLFFRPDDGDNNCTGLGFLQTTGIFDHNAFSVMEGCTFGSSVFAHELGHNMGSRHDWFVEGGTEPRSFAHGYVDFANGFKTIMAYNNRCIAQGGVNCATIPHFSNPLITHNGQATGVAEGTSTACLPNVTPSTECDADNTRTFNETAVATSKFRDSKVVWTGAVSTDWNDADNWTVSRGRPTSPTPDTQVPRSYDNVIIQAGLTTYPIITGDAEARELTIEDGATLAMSGGTLTVNWAWEDAGGFTATAGTVKLIGPIGVTMTSSAGSTFNDVEIGSGSDTTKVTLESDLDINGNFTINGGAGFVAGSNQLNLAGNFADQVGGFKPDTGTVVFDGAAQEVDKTLTQSLLNESFADAAGEGCCGSDALPTGWARSHSSGFGFLSGDITGSNGEAAAWSNSTDSWLITTAVVLSANTNYTLQFDYRNHDFNNTATITSMTAYYGLSQASGAMTNAIADVTGHANFASTHQTKPGSFTVPADGTYYIGFNVKQNLGARTALDNVKLDGTSILQFNNVSVASGEIDFLKTSAIAGNLDVNANATVDLGSNSTTVEGTVTNNGEIKQTLDATAATTTSFVSIKNKDGSADKYYGVDITPAAGLGSTVVSVKGNQTCALATTFVNRCYTITPTTSGTAAVKFYYGNSELNDNTLPFIKTVTGGVGTAVSTTTTTRGGTGDASFVKGDEVTASGEFGLEDTTLPITKPDPFSFTAATGLAGDVLTSDSITVLGINVDSPIKITGVGGTYKINDGAFTDVDGVVTNGNTVVVRNTASATVGDTVETTLTIGDATADGTESAKYTITTEPTKITPVPFEFTATPNETVLKVTRESTQTSNTITVEGINSPAPFTVTIGGSYRINEGDFIIATAASPGGTVNNGDTVTLQHSASALFNTAVDTVLTIGAVNGVGGESGTFTSTTEALDESPNDFEFNDLAGVTIDTLVSSIITVAGINTEVDISMTGSGSYKINEGDFTIELGQVESGDVVTVQHTSSGAFVTPVSTVITIGDKSDTFTSTTEAEDKVPNTFVLVDVTTPVNPGDVQTSNTITVSDINAPTPISVTGGSYKINNGAYVGATAPAGTVNDGDTVTVQHIAGALGSTAETVLTIGGVSETFTSTTIVPVVTPGAFSFTDVTEAVSPGATQTSNVITVTEINTAVPISVTGGFYKINSGPFVDAASAAPGATVSVGDQVTVRHIAGAFGATNDTVLTIGGVSDTFTSTTIAAVTTPGQFTFTDVTTVVSASSIQTSNVITVTGINTAAPISVTGGSYKINNGAYVSAAGTVNDGDTVTVQHIAGALGATVETVLTIGGVSDTFASTTDTDAFPDAFTFTDTAAGVTGTTGVAGSTPVSTSVTVSGINVAVPISVSGEGSYNINGGEFTQDEGTVVNGDVVTLQHTLAASNGDIVETVLNIGGVISTYTSTTVEASTITPTAVPVSISQVGATSDETVPAGAEIVSAPITVQGLAEGATAPISVTNGEYRITPVSTALRGGVFTSEPGFIRNGDIVVLRHIAGSTAGEVTTTTLKLGTVTTTFVSKATEAITGNVKSGGGSMGVTSLMFLSLFTLLCVARRRRLVKGL